MNKKQNGGFIVIAVTGTPGTGKTTIAKFLANKLSFQYINVNAFIKQQHIDEGYDKEKRCLIVDEKKLSNKLVKLIIQEQKTKKYAGIIIDSHLSHYIPAKLVDWCIVTKCDLKTLNKRLHMRKYPKQKIRNNLDAEIFDVCRQEAIEEGHKVMTIITDKEKEWKKQVNGFYKRMK